MVWWSGREGIADRGARTIVSARFLALGLTAMVFWEAAINIGMATGILQAVGIPLPLVSYGGSSLIVLMAAIGLLISINTRRYSF